MTKITTKEQYEWAVNRVEQLLPLADESRPNSPAMIELELLSNMVADYSEVHYAIGEPSLVDVLKLRMYEKGLTVKALSEIVGASTTKVKKLLNGDCEPTFGMARNISKNLGVDPHIVLGV